MSESSSATSQPAPRPRGPIAEGVRRACLNWTYGSLLFAVVDLLAGSLRSTRAFNIFLGLTWLVLVFLASLLVGLLPAAVTGTMLASRLSREGGQPAASIVFQRGAVIGALCLLPVLVILLVAWPPETESSILLFRLFLGLLIAALAGGRTGVQLARRRQGAL